MNTDSMLHGYHREGHLIALACDATTTCAEAQTRHQLQEASAALLSQGVVAALLMAALQKEEARLNLQVTCDGPLGGLFVDASSSGWARGYVKNPLLTVEGHDRGFEWRPALGNRGMLSVLRDQGKGEFYRSSVALEAFDLEADLNRYFASSEQVPMRIALSRPQQPVRGILVQALPDAPTDAVERLRAQMENALSDREWPLADVLSHLGNFDVAHTQSVKFWCPCGKNRVIDTLSTLDTDSLRAMLEEDHGAALTCQFCATRHTVSEDELRAMIAERTALAATKIPMA